MKRCYLKIISGGALAALMLTAAAYVQAAPVSFLTTWRASSFVSSEYQGKILPSPDSNVLTALELVDNGKIADISTNDVSWFLNGKKFANGVGKKSAAFAVPKLFREERLEVKVSVKQYKGADYETFITIPVVSTETVIAAPYPKNQVISGLYAFKPLFYFWNINSLDNLLLEWTAQDQTVRGLGGRDILQLSIPAAARQTALTLTLSANNPSNEYEFAKGSVGLLVE